MAEASDVKSFLYGWLGKKKATPEYNLRPTGPKHRQRFLCELRVPVKILKIDRAFSDLWANNYDQIRDMIMWLAAIPPTKKILKQTPLKILSTI